MPELPEVETIARGLARNLTGDVIESVWLGNKPEPLKSRPGEIVRVLERARIASELFGMLDAPVGRVGALDAWIGYSPSLEYEILPQVENIVEEAQRVLAY